MNKHNSTYHIRDSIGTEAMESHMFSLTIMTITKYNLLSIRLKWQTVDSVLQQCMSYNNVFLVYNIRIDQSERA